MILIEIKCFLMLIIVHDLILKIRTIIFQCYVKVLLTILMKVSVLQKKILALILLRQTQNVARIYITVMIIVICLLMERKSISLGAIDSRKVSLKGNVHDFSVAHNSIDKSDVLNIHIY